MNNIILFLMTGFAISQLQVSSPAFKANDFIPARYSCEGKNINPPLIVKDIPTDAKSLALILDDPDAPNGGFVHWVMWNFIPSSTIDENSAPGTQGKNGRGDAKYTGPCPPSGVHHYHFKIYALNIKLDLKANAGKPELEAAMKGHILATGELIGLYKKTAR